MKEGDFRGCFRGEDVSIEEYFACLPYIMSNYDMDPMLASPKNMLSEKNEWGTRVIAVFKVDNKPDINPEIFHVEEILAFIHHKKNQKPKYDA